MSFCLQGPVYRLVGRDSPTVGEGLVLVVAVFIIISDSSLALNRPHVFFSGPVFFFAFFQLGGRCGRGNEV